MKKSQKLLVASLVTLPVAVVMAGGVQAAETVKPVEIVLPPLEISNSFINKSTATSVKSTENFTVKTKEELHAKLLEQMQGFKNGFMITYDGTAESYNADVEEFFDGLKNKLNKIEKVGGSNVDYTLLYGAFKNVKVEAKEIATTVGETTTKKVELKFSFNYSMDSTAQTALNNLVTQLTTVGNQGEIIKTGMSELQKIKAVHDYVVFNSYVLSSNDNLNALILNKYGSANAYALLTYKLLKAAGISDVRYVAGVSGEGLRAWNVVKVDGNWYHLDTAANDNMESESKHISYQYFLASDEDVKGRTINYGGSGIAPTDWGNAFSAFKNIINPAQAGNVLYYADAQTGGAIKKLEIGDTSVTNVPVSSGATDIDATSGFGKIVYYKLTSDDTASTVISEDLYFINDKVGGYLYKYNLTSGDLKVIINERVTSIKLDRSSLFYTTTIATDEKNILLSDVKEFNKEAVNIVTSLINALSTSSPRAQIETARAKYEELSALAKTHVTAETLEKLVNIESALEGKWAEEKALELDNAILAIGADTLLEDIEALYAEYGTLSATVKAHMKEGKKLENIVKQRREQEVQDIKTAQDQAKLVYDRIEKITANYTEAQIRNIRTAYVALSARAKTYVTNLAKLGAAEANIIYQNTVVKDAKNEAAAFDTYMTNLDRTSSTADIAKARAYYNRLSAEARKHVTAYTKLVRLETMWSKPDYQDLYNNYYPHYIDEIPAGGIEVGQTTPVSLFIPDDSVQNVAYTAYTGIPAATHQNGTTITAEQIRHMNDRTLTLTASDNIKISIPVEELKNTKGTVAVYADVSNGSLIVRFTEDNVVKIFSGFVEIRLPMTELRMTTANILERTTSTSSSTAVNYYFDGKDIVIRTKQSGTFTSKSNTEIYNDLLRVNTGAAKAIRELAKRNITSGAIGKSFLPNSTAKRKDVAIMIARALDVATTQETKLQDIHNLVGGSTIQALLETSIMKGKTATQFSPYANVTRQEGAIILANMLRYLNDDMTKSHNEQTSNYTDVKALTFEVKQSVAILEKAGVLSGEGLFNPTAQLSRAEFAELLYKTMQNAKLL